MGAKKEDREVSYVVAEALNVWRDQARITNFSWPPSKEIRVMGAFSKKSDHKTCNIHVIVMKSILCMFYLFDSFSMLKSTWTLFYTSRYLLITIFYSPHQQKQGILNSTLYKLPQEKMVSPICICFFSGSRQELSCCLSASRRTVIFISIYLQSFQAQVVEKHT